jgi:hypothetical protein
MADEPAQEAAVAFVVGIILFVVLAGVLDARLPWPRPRKGA